MTSCRDCGRTFTQGRGRPTPRCGDCRAVWRTIRKRRPARSPRLCVDCSAAVVPAHTGAPAQRCPECRTTRKRKIVAAKSSRWREANGDRQRQHQRDNYHRTKDHPQQIETRLAARLRQYGITPDDWRRMVKEQDNRCAVCGGAHRGRGNRLHVDHDHRTGIVRALLCGPCNLMIGQADDDPDRLRAAAAYLETHQQ